jgi:hypothetical protein
MEADMDELTPGQTLLRRDVHEIYGGRRQGGIGPSSQTPTVLFFTDPITGHKHGYYDGWDQDGLFNYTGEGQIGPQRLVQGNKAILNHKEDARTLKGFLASGPNVTFMSDFELVDHYWTDAPDTNGDLRPVVVFRLRPLQNVPALDLPQTLVTPSSHTRVDVVPVEEQHTERAIATPDREPYEYERREASLVARYADHLRRKGHVVGRLRVVPPGEVAPLYSDLWDETTQELVEAKGLVTREQMRMAVGQLLDYGRFVDAKQRTVLVPERPRADLRRYLKSACIDVVYEADEVWRRESQQGGGEQAIDEAGGLVRPGKGE